MEFEQLCIYVAVKSSEIVCGFNRCKKQLTAENAGIAEINQEIGLETRPAEKVGSCARGSI